MAKSELLDMIREAFTAAHPEEHSIDAFCAFATDWLASRGIAGIGHLGSGLALRFRDGSELGLINAEEAPQLPSIAVSLSAHRIDRLPNTEPVAVTGRLQR